MADHRKPPLERGSRHEGGTLPSPSDSGGFSIESTTVRLKSMRLQRAEREQREYEELKGASPAAPKPRDPNQSMWPQPGQDRGASAGRPAGRVTHDDRGMAVWDFAIATGEFAALSQTAALKRLSISDLQIEDNTPAPAQPAARGRDVGGGFDPYNQRGSGKREGEAAQRAGITGSPHRERPGDTLPGAKKK